MKFRKSALIYFRTSEVPVPTRTPRKRTVLLFLHILNLFNMVQVEIEQLSAECNVWREKLRHYRDEFSQDETKLRQVAGQDLTKGQLQDVEHLHNQFHIQLINIHDLKQAIKVHDRKMNFEKAAFNGNANEDTLNRHDELHRDYEALVDTLHSLRDEFQKFLQRSA